MSKRNSPKKVAETKKGAPAAPGKTPKPPLPSVIKPAAPAEPGAGAVPKAAGKKALPTPKAAPPRQGAPARASGTRGESFSQREFGGSSSSSSSLTPPPTPTPTPRPTPTPQPTSFLAGVGPSWTGGPGGNQTQVYHWTQPAPVFDPPITDPNWVKSDGVPFYVDPTP
jgi:hypothetical protein